MVQSRHSLGYDPFGNRALPNGIGASITGYLPTRARPRKGHAGCGEGRERAGPTLTASAAVGWAWSEVDAADAPKGCYTALLTRITGGTATQSDEFSRLVCAFELYVRVLYR